MDASALGLYEILRTKKQGRAVAQVVRGNCQGCRITLPTHMDQPVRAGVTLCSARAANASWSPDRHAGRRLLPRAPKSALRSASRGESIGQQNRRFLDYCEAQGFEVATTFSEEAGSTGGPAFSQLIEYLKRPEKGFMVVVAPAPVTLADDAVAAAARCLQVEHLGARVQFMDTDPALEGDALGSILESWASTHNEEVREKVRSALRRKAVRGEVLGRPPYGYKVGSRNRLEVVDDEAVVVRYIFRLYLHEGLGIRLIARRLNEEGLRTRRNKPLEHGEHPRHPAKPRLSRHVPAPRRTGARHPHGARVAGRLPEGAGTAERTANQLLAAHGHGFPAFGHGLLRDCGNRMIGVSRRQTWTRRRDGSEQVASYRYYQCESRTNQGICSYNTQRSEELEETIRKQLSEIDPRQLATAGNDEAVIEQWRTESQRLRDRLHQIDRRLNRELETAAADGTGRERLRSHGHALAEERLKVEEELRDAEWRTEHYASAAERRRTRNAALDVLVSEWETLGMTDKQQLLRELIDQVRVGDEGVSLVLRP